MISKICIIGVGYVGEHLLNTFSQKYHVTGFDLSEKRINELKNKYKHIKNINFQFNYDNLKDHNVFLVSVPTLVKQNKEIDTSFLYNVKNSLINIVQPGSLIVIESSVYVGGTREIFGDFINNSIYVAFSPERVDPGRIYPAMKDIPKVISGLNEKSLDMCKTIYSKVIKNIVPVSSCECAEMCKLYENCFRMINIAYVNEISDMCNNLGIDPYEMIKASSTKPFGFMPFYPGLGVGGHCIPVNPYYLFKNGNLPVLKFSTELMKFRPKKKAQEIITNYNPKNILIVGIGFKKGESLLTNSPGYSLYNDFVKLNKQVSVYDPIVQNKYDKNDIKFLSKQNFNLETLYSNYDLIVVNLQTELHETEILNTYKHMGGNICNFTI